MQEDGAESDSAGTGAQVGVSIEGYRLLVVQPHGPWIFCSCTEPHNVSRRERNDGESPRNCHWPVTVEGRARSKVSLASNVTRHPVAIFLTRQMPGAGARELMNTTKWMRMKFTHSEGPHCWVRRASLRRPIFLPGRM